MINKVILVGRLGRDPEYRTSQSGKGNCRFSLATDTGFGQSRKTDWHSIVCFDNQANFARDYLRKGSLVYIEGRISYGEYERDGVKQKTVDIIANAVQSLGGKNEAQNVGGSFESSRNDAPSYSPQGYSQGGYSASNSSAAESAQSGGDDFGAVMDETALPF